MSSPALIFLLVIGWAVYYLKAPTWVKVSLWISVTSWIIGLIFPPATYAVIPFLFAPIWWFFVATEAPAWMKVVFWIGVIAWVMAAILTIGAFLVKPQSLPLELVEVLI